jgi:RND family efflux transporter MFP subunit
VLEGSSNEEIALAQVTLDNTKKDLENVTKVQNGLVENARRKLNSEGLSAETTSSTTSTPTISGTYTGKEGTYKLSLYSSGDGQYVSFEGLESGTVKASSVAPQPFGTKGLSLLFPNGSSQSATWTVAIPNKDSSLYITNLNTYESAQNTRDAAISTAEAAVRTAEAQLALKRATARQPDVDTALADVITAQAGVESANARLEKKILRAPASGTITKVDIKVGEISTPQKEVIVLQDITNLYLEANIGEGNISTIALGQTVSVSYDALPGQAYTASVSSIDPSATEDGTVINYKIKALITDVATIRPGMTANMSIVTAEIPDVLVLPGRTIQKDDEGQFVPVIISEKGSKRKTARTAVTVGVKGDGDVVEVKTGVTEGTRVLWTPPAK